MKNLTKKDKSLLIFVAALLGVAVLGSCLIGAIQTITSRTAATQTPTKTNTVQVLPKTALPTNTALPTITSKPANTQTLIPPTSTPTGKPPTITTAPTLAITKPLAPITQATAPSVNIPTQPIIQPAAATCPQGCTDQSPTCSIKGNISNTGEKIYHIPGGGSYSATKIEPSAGERWFCTEAEAQANGWRKAGN
jgi:cytoskeletal protein RodZ